MFYTFFKLYKLYQIAQSITMCNVSSGCSLLQEKRRVGISNEVLDLDTRVGVLALINRSLLIFSKNLSLRHPVLFSHIGKGEYMSMRRKKQSVITPSIQDVNWIPWRRPRPLLNVLYTFNIHPVSRVYGEQLCKKKEGASEKTINKENQNRENLQVLHGHYVQLPELSH